MGDGFAVLWSELTKSKDVAVLPALAGPLLDPVPRLFVVDGSESRVGPSLENSPKDRFLLFSGFLPVSCSAFLESAIGSASPRSFPLLATPTPQVRVVL